MVLYAYTDTVHEPTPVTRGTGVCSLISDEYDNLAHARLLRKASVRQSLHIDFTPILPGSCKLKAFVLGKASDVFWLAI